MGETGFRLAGVTRSRSGWMASSRHGLPPLARIEQVKVWEFSHVLRLRAGDVELYFKALAASGAIEPPLVERLATLHPAVMPDVV